jgi:hypothetical protein
MIYKKAFVRHYTGISLEKLKKNMNIADLLYEILNLNIPEYQQRVFNIQHRYYAYTESKWRVTYKQKCPSFPG